MDITRFFGHLDFDPDELQHDQTLPRACGHEHGQLLLRDVLRRVVPQQEVSRPADRFCSRLSLSRKAVVPPSYVGPEPLVFAARKTPSPLLLVLVSPCRETTISRQTEISERLKSGVLNFMGWQRENQGR